MAVTAFALARIEFSIELTTMKRRSTSIAFGTGVRRIDEGDGHFECFQRIIMESRRVDLIQIFLAKRA